MTNFVIDADNNITAFASSQEAIQAAADGGIHFHSTGAFAKATTEWAIERFVEIWNSIPGQKEVTAFKSRKQAVSRIWKVIQPLAKNVESVPEAKAKAGSKPAKAAKAPKKAKATKQ